ncbi:MAG: HK97-gp10 family putative phage morphogenesis protein [Pyramidobacter porci]|uniref:HK97-gp10 family putative phage morphogenesis protein n=1 Tax=Pyramidobacter porci TaxID=2605789 RepID=UPI002A7646B7|nr:HK97-gp10 family putative phage morphogenesis protein [Pyramidobacter porci]MDY2649153.1 HK97-gp10 family putative phage morphogenesis protein [Pyramidobacter porci]
MSVKVIGSDKLLKGFKELPEKMNKALGDELEKTGEEIRDEAKRLAPVRTGALRESIKKRVWRRNGRTTVKVLADYPKTGRYRKAKTRKQAAGSREYYAFAVEYGTKHVEAQPFLMPAARKAENGLEQRVSSNMDIVLNKEFK